MMQDYNAPVTREEAALIQREATVFDPSNWGNEDQGY